MFGSLLFYHCEERSNLFLLFLFFIFWNTDLRNFENFKILFLLILFSIQYIHFLALIEGKNLCVIARNEAISQSFGMKAGFAIIENAQAIRF